MTKEEFLQENEIEDGTIILEPWETFSQGIVGVTENHCRIVYEYDKLADAIAQDYERDWEGSEDEKPDFLMDAYEWLDCNTLRSIPYLGDEFAPIVIFPVNL